MAAVTSAFKVGKNPNFYPTLDNTYTGTLGLTNFEENAIMLSTKGALSAGIESFRNNLKSQAQQTAKDLDSTFEEIMGITETGYDALSDTELFTLVDKITTRMEDTDTALGNAIKAGEDVLT